MIKRMSVQTDSSMIFNKVGQRSCFLTGGGGVLLLDAFAERWWNIHPDTNVSVVRSDVVCVVATAANANRITVELIG